MSALRVDDSLFCHVRYCEGGDLYNRLKEQKGVALEERQVVEWFVQIAMALQVNGLFNSILYFRLNLKEVR